MNRTARLTLITLLSLSTLGTTVHAASLAATPEGFSGLGVFVADGEFIPGSPNPDVPGCDLIPAFCDIDYFWNEVVQFTPEEAAAEIAEAKAFMMERYGIDVDALVATGEILWIAGYADPRINYRARLLPNQNIHRLGWEVHDLSLLVITTVSLELGGEFDGMVIPPGSILAKGLYVIQKSRLVEHDGHTVLVNLPGKAVIEFQSGAPILASADPRVPIVANCEITESPWGSGVALVPTFPFMGNGEPLKQGIRNVLTFDGADGFGDYVGVYNDPDLIIIEP